jgi:hypothetical protein
MTRTMFDSADAADIPLNGASMIGCYTDGSFTTVVQAAQRFPRAQLVTIDVNGSNPHARALDCEAGDVVNVTDAANWLKDSKMLGNQWPTIYHEASGLGDWINGVSEHGLELGKDWWIWVAKWGPDWQQYQGVTGFAAVQDADLGAYDTSVVIDDNWIPASLPGEPVTLLTSPLSTVCQLNAGWIEPHGVVLPYKIQLERLEPKGWVLVQEHTTDSDFKTLTDLAPRELYRWRASGGNWSDWAEFRTP